MVKVEELTSALEFKEQQFQNSTLKIEFLENIMEEMQRNITSLEDELERTQKIQVK